MAITILVRNPNAGHEGCRILYRDIGDYLKREDKLALLREARSIAGIEDWRQIAPNRHHDWIGQRDEAFQTLYPMASKAAKAGKEDKAIFKLYSNGYKTGRDAYLYNFSRDACAENARKMVDDYVGALRELEAGEKPDLAVDNATRRYSASIRWDQKLKHRVQQRVTSEFISEYIREVAYRPFVKQYLYADQAFSQRPGLTGDIFPTTDSDNRAICVPGVGSTKPFSALVVDTMPDLHFVAFGQCFPRYRYAQPPTAQGELPEIGLSLERIDNITDEALDTFRAHYDDHTITKDAIFDFVYGVLHAPGYREQWADDLAKALPRIPFATDFHAFADAGRALAELHLGYETCQEFSLNLACSQPGDPRPEHYRMSKRAMRYADDDRTVCNAPGFLDSGLKVITSTLPRPARRNRVALGLDSDSRTSPASTARCTSVETRARRGGVPRSCRSSAPTRDSPVPCG